MVVKKGKYKVCVVDDNVLFLKVMHKHLSNNPDLDVTMLASGREFIPKIDEKPDIVTLDYTLPDYNGKEILKMIMEKSPETNVVIVSGQQDINTAIELMKIGAYDYIVKSTDTREKIMISINKIIERIELTRENKNLKEAVEDKYKFRNLIKGNSKPMENMFAYMDKAAKTNITISVFGETGTGKEIVAKAIHYNSKRSTKPFVAVNISSIPDTLIESELFGYDKGAFTGADSSKPGRIEMADGGTLFLDEIAEMNLNTQAKLLRVLQEREVTRLGSNKIISFDTRIIIATHRNLQEQVQNGEFREDLYFRLLGLTIELPPLRDRGSDCLMLAKHFANEFCNDNEISHKQLSEGAKNKISQYHFPGNVRELKAVMELACVLSDGKIIETSHININPISNQEAFLQTEKSLYEYNVDIIKHFVDKYNNVREAARRLGVGKSTIYRYLQNES